MAAFLIILSRSLDATARARIRPPVADVPATLELFDRRVTHTPDTICILLEIHRGAADVDIFGCRAKRDVVRASRSRASISASRAAPANDSGLRLPPLLLPTRQAPVIVGRSRMLFMMIEMPVRHAAMMFVLALMIGREIGMMLGEGPVVIFGH
jgi:hypothetical protein